MPAMHFVLMGLATWRLASLAVKEDGPWDLLCRLRHLIGVRYDEHSRAYGLNVVASGLTCVWCASVWVGGLLTVAYLAWPVATWLACLPLALSAAACWLEGAIDGNR